MVCPPGHSAGIYYTGSGDRWSMLSQTPGVLQPKIASTFCYARDAPLSAKYSSLVKDLLWCTIDWGNISAPFHRLLQPYVRRFSRAARFKLHISSLYWLTRTLGLRLTKTATRTTLAPCLTSPTLTMRRIVWVRLAPIPAILVPLME